MNNILCFALRGVARPSRCEFVKHDKRKGEENLDHKKRKQSVARVWQLDVISCFTEKVSQVKLRLSTIHLYLAQFLETARDHQLRAVALKTGRQRGLLVAVKPEHDLERVLRASKPVLDFLAGCSQVFGNLCDDVLQDLLDDDVAHCRANLRATAGSGRLVHLAVIAREFNLQFKTKEHEEKRP